MKNTFTLADTTMYKDMLYWAPETQGFGPIVSAWFLQESLRLEEIADKGLIVRVERITPERVVQETTPVTDVSVIEKILRDYLFPRSRQFDG